MIKLVESMWVARRREQMIFSPWWRRVCAELIDLAVVTVIANVLLLIWGGQSWWWYTHKGHLAAGTIAELYITVDIAALLYYPVLVWRTNGQTIGKKLLRIRVVRADSRRMGLVLAIGREVGIKFVLLDLITILPIVGASLSELIFLADVLWPLWDRENRALHDMLAGTRVISLAPAASRNETEVVGNAAL